MLTIVMLITLYSLNRSSNKHYCNADHSNAHYPVQLKQILQFFQKLHVFIGCEGP